jgi:hypothetical protein
VKDSILTVRIPSATRRRLEQVAKAEGRSLSQQVERWIEERLRTGATVTGPTGPERGTRSLAGVLKGGEVPSLEDFREARRFLSDSIGSRIARRRR